jgi:hypothetical protein
MRPKRALESAKAALPKDGSEAEVLSRNGYGMALRYSGGSSTHYSIKPVTGDRSSVLIRNQQPLLFLNAAHTKPSTDIIDKVIARVGIE